MNGIRVFSAFGGIECGRQALLEMGVPVARYVSSEIKPHAIAITRYRHPDVEHAGDITQVNGMEYRGFDLLMGGSPCQDLSVGNSGGEGLAGLRSGLFYHFIRLLGEMRPKYFLLENVRPKRREWGEEISRLMGVQPIIINSELVSAQHRERWYWTNIPGITQPTDLGIRLVDILQPDWEDKYEHTQKGVEYLDREVNDGRTHWDFSQHADTLKDKSMCVVKNMRKGVPYNVLLLRKEHQLFDTPKNKNGVECIGIAPESFKPKGNYLPRERIFSTSGKSRAISRHVGQYPYYKDGDIIRRFTPIEVERLQTLPDDYTKFGLYGDKVKQVPDTHRYDCVGDGWTVKAVGHILSFADFNI